MKLVTLEDADICLRELDINHLEALNSAAQDQRIWEFNSDILKPEDFAGIWFSKVLQQHKDNERLTYTIFLSGEAIGATSYYEISEKCKRLKIGHTWYHPKTWGTGINAKVKYLMLNYSFEILLFNRVGFSIDSQNMRSRKAVEKLGAKFEGILRQYFVRPDGTLKDVAYYSILAQEWPMIKNKLLGVSN